MNTEPTPDPRAEREARLTAFLLGELPPAEADALRRELANDPHLAALHDDLARAVGLLRETVAVPAEPAGAQPARLRLSEERRRKLLAHFQTAPMRPANVTVVDTTARQPRDVRWLLPLAAAVVVMLAGASLFLPALSLAKRSPKEITAIASRRSVAMDDYVLAEPQARQLWAFDSEERPARGGDTTVAGQLAQVELRLADQPTEAPTKAQFGAIVLPTEDVGSPMWIGVLDQRQQEFAGGQGGGGSGYVPTEQSVNRFIGRNAFVTHPESLALDEAALQQAQGNARSVRVDPATGGLIPADTAGLPAIAATPSSSTDGRDGTKTDFQTRLGTIVNRAATGSGGMVAAGEPVALGRLEVLAEGGGAKRDGFLGNVSINGASPASAPNLFYYNGASTPVLKSPDLNQNRWGDSSTLGRDAGVDLLTSAVTSTRRDTEKELDLIDKASQGLAASPAEGMIEARFAEVAQSDAKALGLNWQLGGRPESDERLQRQSGTAPAASDPTSGSQFAKSGAGTLRLNGGNTYAGGTLANAGTLTVNGGAVGGGAVRTDGFAANEFWFGNAPRHSPPPDPSIALQGTGPTSALTSEGGEVRGEQVIAGAPIVLAGRAWNPPARPQPAQSAVLATNFVVPHSLLPAPDAPRSEAAARMFGGGDAKQVLTVGALESPPAPPAPPQTPAPPAASPVPVLGDLPVVGRLFRSGKDGDAEAKPALIAGRHDGEDNQRKLAEVDKTVASLEQQVVKLQTALGTADREGSAGATTMEPETLRRMERGLNASEDSGRLKKAEIAVAQQARPYFGAKRELEEQEQVRDVLKRKIAQESMDLAIPKSSTVQIIDQAQAGAAEKPSLWGRLSGAFSGEVARSARISTDKEVTDIATMGQAQASSGYDPHFATVELAGIKSKLVLQEVIDRLQLHTAWGGMGEALSHEETLNRLRDKIEVTKNPTTDLIEIRAKGATSKEAALIANTVAEVYRDVRAEQRSAKIRGGVQVLNQRLAEQEKLVASLEGELKKREQPAAVESEPPAPAKPAGPAPVPQPEVLARENAFSTFSLNVSDVSFKLAAASLAQGQWPDPASVRAEEFLNAFDYRDAEPAPGAPLAFNWERARHPFAHNRDLLRFSLKTAAVGRQAGRPLNLVLLLDNSGSMERADRVRIVREALRSLGGQLQPQDKLSVITFARTPRLWVDGISGAQAGAVADQVGGLTPQGGTNIEEAMRLGYETARRHYRAGGINHVVLLTDGAANLGNVDPASLQKQVEAHRQQGIALDCFGVGWEGFNDDLLEVLARNGDGRYGFLNSPAEAATQFAGALAGALRVAAADVKVQVEFNPRRVTAWRQVGYAKHQLTKEQFRDNTVDAAELAAREAGNALYAVEVDPRGEGPIATVRARFKVPGTRDYREHAWEVPFAGGATALEQASPAMRLAVTAGAFAEWLVNSPFAAEVTADRLLEHLRGVPEVFGADARPKQLEEMIRQAKGLRR